MTTKPINAIDRRPAKPARTERRSAPPDPRLRFVALAVARFEEWFALAGQRSKDAFRVFPAAELRRRFSNLQIAIVGMDGVVPPAARRSLESVREGIRSELQEATGREVSFGAFFVDEVGRLTELLKLYAREAGFTDTALAARDRPSGEKLSSHRKEK